MSLVYRYSEVKYFESSFKLYVLARYLEDIKPVDKFYLHMLK